MFPKIEKLHLLQSMRNNEFAMRGAKCVSLSRKGIILKIQNVLDKSETIKNQVIFDETMFRFPTNTDKDNYTEFFAKFSENLLDEVRINIYLSSYNVI